MGASLTWTCECGQTSARIDPGDGAHVVCYCDDCQAFARHLGRADWLDEAGGSALFQTTPARIEMIRGAENLACLRLTEKGPYRWYASCCGTPFANTLTTRQVPFSSIQTHGFDTTDALGPVSLRANRKFAWKRVQPKGSFHAAALAILRRAIIARLAGRHTRTPFFDDSGTPVGEIQRLSPEERRAAYARPRA